MNASHEPIATWLPCRERRIEPWRNGGGSTQQVAIDPPAATAQHGFRWRVSIARVAAPGPFSSFPGVDRSLWLLDGNGMALDLGSRVVRIDQPLQRFDFGGEAAITARLLDGPTEDLNVMCDRAAVEAVATILRFDAGERLQRVLPDAQHLVLAIAGAVGLPRWRGSLGERDAVRSDGAQVLDVEATDAPAVLLVASFAARARGVTSRGP